MMQMMHREGLSKDDDAGQGHNVEWMNATVKKIVRTTMKLNVWNALFFNHESLR